MLYSGAWEQPTNTSGAVRDKPARGRNEVLGVDRAPSIRYSYQADLIYVEIRLYRAHHPVDATAEEQFPHGQSEAQDHFSSIGMGH